MDKPAEIFNLISLFIRGYDVPIPPNYVAEPEFTPEYKPDSNIVVSNSESSSVNVGLIISIVLNVLLIVGVVLGAVLYLRWKKRHEMFLYNNMEETGVAESVLTLT